MINEQDIELMHEWQDEIYSHRERPVTVIYVDKAYDPITGVPIGETEQTRELTAVVTEISSSGSGLITASKNRKSVYLWRTKIGTVRAGEFLNQRTPTYGCLA